MPKYLARANSLGEGIKALMTEGGTSRRWAEMAACYYGDVSVTNSEDVAEYAGGGSNDAGFVQVMKASGVDGAACRS